MRFRGQTRINSMVVRNGPPHNRHRGERSVLPQRAASLRPGDSSGTSMVWPGVTNGASRWLALIRISETCAVVRPSIGCRAASVHNESPADTLSAVNVGAGALRGLVTTTPSIRRTAITIRTTTSRPPDTVRAALRGRAAAWARAVRCDDHASVSGLRVAVRCMVHLPFWCFDSSAAPS